ncbi:MAG: sugar kinase [Oscillospiraceae bacterium]|nr:sugar kinase [Oscillospiraceae bacterium]MDY3064916.1 sugar kinase [Oscillospiraceae bacterium]
MIVTFGEMLLRLSPPAHLRFAQASSFDAYYGGAEANTAVCLSCLGEAARHVTCLPANALGRACAGELARYGVDTSCVSFDYGENSRLGLYFCENGASQRASQVLYDRQNSAFTRLRRGDFDWESIFDNADWFHFTGITPALSKEMAEIVLDACKEAKRRKISVSFDINYRAGLWSRERAKETLSRFLPYVTLLLANNGSLFDVFGIDAGNGAADSSPEAALAAAKEASKRFAVPEIALTMRRSHSASYNGWSAMLYSRESKQAVYSPNYNIEIVDRVGGGDAFAAGLIFAKRRGFDAQHAVSFAAAVSCLKHTIPGDMAPVRSEEAEDLLADNGAGLIRR